MQLSKNFSLAELTKSQTAERTGCKTLSQRILRFSVSSSLGLLANPIRSAV
jgi:hypothetical protein